MIRLRLFLFTLLVPALVLCLLLGGCSTSNSSKMKVVTGSSLLTYIVQQIGKDKVEVTNLVPPAQHPGDFNVKPGDIQNLSKADLFLLHGWPGEKYADQFVASANNPGLKVVKTVVDGNWMIPSVQSAAVDKVTGILGEIDSKNSADYQKAADEYKKRIQAKETDIKERLSQANVSQTNVIASVRQADFLKWAGFNITATYASPDALTPQIVKDLLDKGKNANVTLVINNIQDSADAGKGIAEELGAQNINLSNFPGALDNTETWEKAIDRNVDLLLKAVSR
jgi:zinc transport system substrate-binding protein